MRKQISFYIIVAIVIGIISGNAVALDKSNVNILVEEGFRGANPPSSGASTHDLSISSYNYQINEVGAQVYTDKWLTGASSMKVTVGKMTALNVPDDTCTADRKTTVTVYNSSGTEVASKLISENSNYTFTGLSSSSKYYIKFAVGLSGVRWKFSGTISKV
jgi:hypothetical protein